MTDAARRARGVAALAVVPLSAGVLSGALAWANAHDPSTVEPTATATPSTDPQVAAMLAEVTQARARILELKAVLAERAAAEAEAARLAGQQAAAQAAAQAATRAAAAAAQATEARRAAAAAPPAAPAPKPETTTRSSG